jgi:hypothetical protein
VRIGAGAPVLAATLNTPRGRMRLRSPTDLTKALRP